MKYPGVKSINVIEKLGFSSAMLAFSLLLIARNLSITHYQQSRIRQGAYNQWAFCAKMMSSQRRCDVITSHRRKYDVILRNVPAGIITHGAMNLNRSLKVKVP